MERHATTGEWTHPQSAKLSAGWQDRNKVPRQKEEARPSAGAASSNAGAERAANASKAAAWQKGAPYVMTEADLRKRKERAARRRKFQSGYSPCGRGIQQRRRQRRLLAASLALVALTVGVLARRRAALE